MTEYTSLEVSKRLKAAGFKIRGDAVGREPSDNFKESGENFWRYRSDTLLTWLLNKGVGVYIDRKSGVDYVYPYGADAESVIAPALPDALAEVVMQVLKKAAG